MQKFLINHFIPDEENKLGSGLWGDVYNLGDSTVIKIARDKSSGIGSGREKIDTEARILQSLSAQEFSLSPTFIGKGDIPDSHSLFQQGFSLYLHMQEIKGTSFRADSLRKFPLERFENIGRSIGQALSKLHEAFRRIGINDGAVNSQHHYFDEIKPDIKNDPVLIDAVNFLDRFVKAIPSNCFNSLVHGDFNISNILFKDDNVSGILDFAECGIGFPEKDIADVIKENPELKFYVISEYEKFSGHKVNENYVILGLAENALYGTAISAKNGDMRCAEEYRKQLLDYIRILGYCPQQIPPITFKNPEIQ